MNKRIIAILGILIIVLSTVFVGCGKKITKEDVTTTDDGKIKLNGGYEDIPAGSQIVVDANGDSYLVDGEGNSIVYNAQTEYVIPDVPVTPVQIDPSSTTTRSTTKKPIPTIPSSTEPSTTAPQYQDVIKTMSAYRNRSDSNAGVKGKLGDAADFKTLSIKFDESEYGGKNSFRIELHKGVYGTSTVGCELGVYVLRDESYFGAVGESENISGSAQLYNSKSGSKVTQFGESKTGWHYSFINASPVNSDELVMVATLKLNELRMDALTDELEEHGFVSGVTGGSTPYKNKGNYSVSEISGKKGMYEVTLVW